MNVLVDTSLWSLALRRRQRNKKERVYVGELGNLIHDNRAQIIGPIRQELLSGIPHGHQFETLRAQLESFEDLILRREDYEMAAEFYNQCRARGVQGSHIDFLICAVAHRHGFPIFTTDRDFLHFSKILPISLHI